MFCCVTLFNLFCCYYFLQELFYYYIIILFINNFFIKFFLIFYVLEWSVFGFISMPDKDKVEECKQCTRFIIHTFATCDQ